MSISLQHAQLHLFITTANKLCNFNCVCQIETVKLYGSKTKKNKQNSNSEICTCLCVWKRFIVDILMWPKSNKRFEHLLLISTQTFGAENKEKKSNQQTFWVPISISFVNKNTFKYKILWTGCIDPIHFILNEFLWDISSHSVFWTGWTLNWFTQWRSNNQN